MKSSRLTEIRELAEHHNGKGSKCVEMLLECVAEIKTLQKRLYDRTVPNAPTLSEVMQFAERNKWPAGQAEEFFDHYEMVGWVYGKSRHPIRKPEAAMRRWARSFHCVNGTKPGIGNKYGVG